MSGRSTFRHSLEKGSFCESYTDDCNWSVFGVDVPEFVGDTAGDRKANSAALLCRRAVFREPDDVRLLRHALATLAAGKPGAGFDTKARGADVPVTKGSLSLCRSASRTGRSQSAAAERACGRANTCWCDWRRSTHHARRAGWSAATRDRCAGRTAARRDRVSISTHWTSHATSNCSNHTAVRAGNAADHAAV